MKSRIQNELNEKMENSKLTQEEITGEAVNSSFHDTSVYT